MCDKFSNCSDEELVRLIRNQDHGAFSELVTRYSAKLYSTAYRMLMNRTDSEDMVQDVFMKLWNEPDSWKENSNAKFTTWFYRVIINQCIDYKRKKKYRNHEEYKESASGKFNTAEILENRSRSELINMYIMELPERQQIALNLYYYENMNINEAAEIMGLKPKGLESLVSRAKENLRNRLKVHHDKQEI